MDSLLINGHVEYVSDVKDVHYIIEKYCGKEFADYLVEQLTDIDEEEMYAEARAQTDADYIMAENESLRSALYECKAQAEQMHDLLEKQKLLSRENLIGRCRDIEIKCRNAL